MTLDVPFIKKIAIFRDLADDEAGRVLQVMVPRTLPADAILFGEGEPGDSLFLLAEGEVAVHKALTMKVDEDDFRELEKTLVVLKAEDHQVFGEMGLVTDAPRSATITAGTNCLLYEISRASFLELARTEPGLGFKIAYRLAELLATRLKKSSDDVVRLTTALSIALTQ